MVEIHPNAYRNTVEKGVIAPTRKIFFPNVFKRLKLQTHKTRDLFGRGLTVLLKLVVQLYLLSLFSPMKRLHSTVPVKLQNVEILLKYEKSAVRKMRTYSFSHYILKSHIVV